MREIRTSGSMSGDGRRSQAKPDCGGGAKGPPRTHRKATATAPVLDSTLVAGEPAVDRLPHHAEQPVPDVPPAPPFRESRHAHRGQVEGVVQLTVGEQAAVRGDARTVEFELDAAVERDPQRGSFGFTRRVRHPASTLLRLCR